MVKGEKKEQLCQRYAFESEIGVFCPNHFSMINKKKKKDVPHEWTLEMQELYSKNKIDGLKNILRGKVLKISGTKRELVYRIFMSSTMILHH